MGKAKVVVSTCSVVRSLLRVVPDFRVLVEPCKSEKDGVAAVAILARHGDLHLSDGHTEQDQWLLWKAHVQLDVLRQCNLEGTGEQALVSAR